MIYPQIINAKETFDALVQWFYKDIILERDAPGFLIGLSGTDSIIAFLAAYKALEQAGKPHAMMGVHFAPSEDFLYDHPEAEVHLWFSKQIIPWLKEQAPKAQIVVDTSIDWRCDGLRWGALMDMSVVYNDDRRSMRLPDQQYWVVGTRNRTEDRLMNYSNASASVSLQPLIYIWKSEVMQLSEYLNVPKLAMDKSCETDCICGRERLAAKNIKEIDLLLMARSGHVSPDYVANKISPEKRNQLNTFIESQIKRGRFKNNIPYTPSYTVPNIDPLILSFEVGTLSLKEFNHYKHLQIAWSYLGHLSFEEALERYAYFLKLTLDEAKQSHRFNLELTRAYFEKVDRAMKLHPTNTFEELTVKYPDVLTKISA